MNYVQIETIDTVIDRVASTLSSHLLSGERVVWLLSGGSAIELEVRIAQALQSLDVTRLYVGLIDERYGPPGHQDENHLQLMNAFFPFYITRVLSGKSGQETAESFGVKTKQAIKDADYSLGIFGVGLDGHTAGIKPGSPATISTKPAIYYDWDGHQRITLTPPTIQQLDEAIIYAIGSEKTKTLRKLIQKDLAINDQPAQLLKGVKNSTLFTDNSLNGAKKAGK